MRVNVCVCVSVCVLSCSVLVREQMTTGTASGNSTLTIWAAKLAAKGRKAHSLSNHSHGERQTERPRRHRWYRSEWFTVVGGLKWSSHEEKGTCNQIGILHSPNLDVHMYWIELVYKCCSYLMQSRNELSNWYVLRSSTTFIMQQPPPHQYAEWLSILSSCRIDCSKWNLNAVSKLS